MNHESYSAARRPLVATAAAFAATIVALGIFSAVATLFQSRGAPLQALAAAERACAHERFVSDREACMQRWAADQHRTIIAAH